MNVSSICRVCGSVRASMKVLNSWKNPSLVSGMKWQTKWVSSGVTLRATEGEGRLMGLLKEKLNPTYLAVEDVSGGCGTAYIIHVDSEQFKGKRIIQQHKLVNEAIGDEMKNIHSVSIKIGSPDN